MDKRISVPLLATLSTLLLISSLWAQGQHKPGSIPPPQVPFVIKSVSHHVTIPTQLVEAGSKANAADIRGEAALQAGDIEAALDSFNEALTYAPHDGQAYVGLASAYEVKGLPTQAIAAYRTLFYHFSGNSSGNSQETDARILMRYALLLLKTGQRLEALKVYQRGVHCLPTDRGPLPSLFTTPDFAAADFQAAAYTAMGLYITAWSDPNGGEADIERAIATQPSLATPYFYRGLILKGRPGRAADALAAFDRAARLGGPAMQPFVDKALKDGTSEFTAAVKKTASATQP